MIRLTPDDLAQKQQSRMMCRMEKDIPETFWDYAPCEWCWKMVDLTEDAHWTQINDGEDEMLCHACAATVSFLSCTPQAHP